MKSNPIKVYFKNCWNKMDFVGTLVFFLGSTVRFVALFSTIELFYHEAAK